MMERGWVKFLVFTGAFVGVFALALWASLPDDEVGEIARKNIESALGNQYDVTFESFSFSGVSAIEAHGVNITTRAPSIDASERELEAFRANRIDMTVDRIYIDFAIFASAFARRPVVDFEMDFGTGSLTGTYSQVPYEPVAAKGARKTRSRSRRAGKGAEKGKKGKKGGDDGTGADPPADEEEAVEATLVGHRVDALASSLPLGSVDILQSITGAPVKGTLDGSLMVLLDASGQRLLDANIDLEVKGTTIGPGPLPFDTGFGRFEVKLTTVGDLVVKAKVEENKLQIENVSTTGPDVVFEAAGYMTLGNTIAGSSARINARVKPSKDFLTRNDLQGMLDIDPKVRRAKSGEYYGFIINGPLTRLKPIPNKRAATGQFKK
jgi:hypothetical protein